MITGKRSPHAIIVLPGRASQIRDRALRRWLSQGRLHSSVPNAEILVSVLELIGHSVEGEGLAALHFWGQTGEPSSSWMAAADPVHLEVRLDYLCLHALGEAQIPLADLQAIVDYLQATFGSESTAFARVNNQAYLRGADKIASAMVSARFVEGRRPDEFMPQGSGAESLDLLISEVQMALHEHPVNIDREQAGQLTVNSFWIWGGGMAPAVSTQPILPLFADDPLFRGFWHSRTGLVEPWSDRFEDSIELADKGFVSVVPDPLAKGQSAGTESSLRQVQTLLQQGRLSRATFFFRDGLRADLTRGDRYRFWRRESSLLSAQ